MNGRLQAAKTEGAQWRVERDQLRARLTSYEREHERLEAAERRATELVSGKVSVELALAPSMSDPKARARCQGSAG